MPASRNARRAAVLALAALLPLLSPRSSAGAEEASEHSHCVAAQIGAQIGINEYRSFLKLGAAYAKHITRGLWFDLAAAALPAEDTNLLVDLGFRWRFNEVIRRVRPYVRASIASGHMFQDRYRASVGLRGGGGIAYYSLSQTVGATAEINGVVGPAFGGNSGVGVAAAIDILVGLEVQF
jgi:hypothetical protein